MSGNSPKTRFLSRQGKKLRQTPFDTLYGTPDVF
jgi:hypothetical protein